MTPQSKRVLAFILGLCIFTIGGLMIRQETLTKQVISVSAVVFGAGLIGLSALKEEYWR